MTVPELLLAVLELAWLGWFPAHWVGTAAGDHLVCLNDPRGIWVSACFDPSAIHLCLVRRGLPLFILNACRSLVRADEVLLAVA